MDATMPNHRVRRIAPPLVLRMTAFRLSVKGPHVAGSDIERSF
jgi:hypothetical protein